MFPGGGVLSCVKLTDKTIKHNPQGAGAAMGQVGVCPASQDLVIPPTTVPMDLAVTVLPVLWP